MIVATGMATTPGDQPTFAATIWRWRPGSGCPGRFWPMRALPAGRVEALKARGIEPLVAIWAMQDVRPYDFRPPPAEPKPDRAVNEPWRLAMQAKMNTEPAKALYRLRKQTVEPVFGIVKAAMGFRQFLMRGLAAAVEAEWPWLALAYNAKRDGHAPRSMTHTATTSTDCKRQPKTLKALKPDRLLGSLLRVDHGAEGGGDREELCIGVAGADELTPTGSPPGPRVQGMLRHGPCSSVQSALKTWSPVFCRPSGASPGLAGASTASMRSNSDEKARRHSAARSWAAIIRAGVMPFRFSARSDEVRAETPALDQVLVQEGGPALAEHVRLLRLEQASEGLRQVEILDRDPARVSRSAHARRPSRRRARSAPNCGVRHRPTRERGRGWHGLGSHPSSRNASATRARSATERPYQPIVSRELA